MNKKRHISPPRPFVSPVYLLFYIRDEKKYITMSSTSTLLPKNFHSTKVKEKEVIQLKYSNSFVSAMYISQASTLDELHLKQTLMTKHLDEGGSIDLDSSLGFLRPNIIYEPGLPGASGEPISVHEADENRNCLNDSMVSESHEAISRTENTSQENSIPLLKESIKLQKQILEELVRFRRQEARRWRRSMRDAHVEPPVDQVEGNFEEEMYNGKDLVKIKPFNMDISQYGTKVSRILWTDEELSEGRLLPRRSTGRSGTLSPNRTLIFKRAVKKRFHLSEDEDLSPAITAVNQLGSDVNRGKRRRQ